MYFHTDDLRTLNWLAAVVSTAAESETSIRIDVDDQGRINVKRGGGMWSGPIESTFDLSRDKS